MEERAAHGARIIPTRSRLEEISNTVLGEVLEALGVDGNAVMREEFLPVRDEATQAIRFRTFEDSRGHRVVSGHLVSTAPPFESITVFAFGRPGSAVPHFNFDVMKLPHGVIVTNVDLLPTVDLATSVAYMDEVYGTLTDARERFLADFAQDLTLPKTDPRQMAVCSPWLVAPEGLGPPVMSDAERGLEGIARAYGVRWAELARDGLSARTVARDLAGLPDLVAIERQKRLTQFSKRLDLGWENIERMFGEAAGRAIFEDVMLR